MFRFSHKETGQLEEVCGLERSKTKRNGYVVIPVTAVCVIMRKLSFTMRWENVETNFCSTSSSLTKGAL